MAHKDVTRNNLSAFCAVENARRTICRKSLQTMIFEFQPYSLVIKLYMSVLVIEWIAVRDLYEWRQYRMSSCYDDVSRKGYVSSLEDLLST